jgi:hypothetical protein
MRLKKAFGGTILSVWILLLAVGCTAGVFVVPTPAPPSVTPTVAPIGPTATPLSAAGGVAGLSEAEITTLNSLEKVDDYPLYIMHFHGAFETAMSAPATASVARMWNSQRPAWACSLFAALADSENLLFGRNFDWQYSPAVLLFTDPPNAYASVSMVDIAYLFGTDKAGALADLPLTERHDLLYTPLMPFDGMNEHGLAVGMAAVVGSKAPRDPSKETVDSLLIMRAMLDHARTVDEAVELLDSYNIEWGSGPPLHYLIADLARNAVLVEFYEGETVVIPQDGPWHQATNFLRAEAGEAAAGRCERYDAINQRLEATAGRLDAGAAVDLLEQVAQLNTQWSVVYEMATRRVHVVMGRHYDRVHTFELSVEAQ